MVEVQGCIAKLERIHSNIFSEIYELAMLVISAIDEFVQFHKAITR